MKKRMLMVLSGLMVAGSAMALTYTRTSSTTLTNWTDLAGWRDNDGGTWGPSTVFPGSADTVVLNIGPGVTVNTDATVSTMYLVNNANNGTVNMTISGKTLNATTIGVGSTTASGAGTLNQTAGTIGVTTISVGGQTAAAYNLGGAGTLNAATLNVGTTAGAAGAVNQSGGSANATAFNIGADGTYNLTGGNLSASANSSISGLLNIDGGTFTVDKDIAQVTISSDGLLKLQSGTFNNIGSDATDLMIMNNNVEISGGTVDLTGQSYFTGEFRVIGDAATISIDRLNNSALNNGDFVFEMGENGVSMVDGLGSFMHLNNASVTVDGSAYTGGAGTFTLFRSSNLASTSTATSVTGFTGGLSGYITQDMDSDLVTLTVIPEPAVLGLIVLFGGGMLAARRLFEK